MTEMEADARGIWLWSILQTRGKKKQMQMR